MNSSLSANPFRNSTTFGQQRLQSITCLAGIAMSLLLCLTTKVWSAPDDVAAPVDPVRNGGRVVNNFEQAFNNIEINVFQTLGSAKQARAHLETKLKMQVNEVNRVCELGDEQYQKLKLAGSNDIRRLFDEYEALRKKYQDGKKDQEAWNGFWQEVRPLQLKLTSGLFGPNSFLAKSIRGVLTTEQVTKYKLVETERQRFRYRACIDATLQQVQYSVPMTVEQEEALVELLLQETNPPLVFGQHNFQVVLHNMARIPETKLKAILGARQWPAMLAQLNQYRGLEIWMQQQGIIAPEDAEPKKPRVRVRRQVQASTTADGISDATLPENKTDAKPVQ